MIWTMLRRFTRQAITQAPGGGKRGTPEPPSGGTHLPAAPAPAAGSLTDAERRHLAALAALPWPPHVAHAGRHLANTLRRDDAADDLTLARTCLVITRYATGVKTRTATRSGPLAWVTDVTACAALELTELERMEVPR